MGSNANGAGRVLVAVGVTVGVVVGVGVSVGAAPSGGISVAVGVVVAVGTRLHPGCGSWKANATFPVRAWPCSST